MTITALPTPPTRQDPVNFSARGDLFMSALPVFVDEANALQVDVNAKSAAAASSATLASAKASDAAAARDIVMAAVNYKGVWSSLSGALSIPASVLHNGVIWMLSQNVATVQSVTPGVSAVWINVTPASGLGTAAYQDSSAFQASFGALSGLVIANGAGGVSAALAADIIGLIGASAVQNATSAGTAMTAGTANAIVDGAVSSTAKLANRVVTWAKHAAITTNKLLGRSSSGGGDVEEISLGPRLSLVGGELRADVGVTSVGGLGGVGDIGAVTLSGICSTGYGYVPANPANTAPLTSFVAATSYEYTISGTASPGAKVLFVRANGSTFELITEFSREPSVGGGA